MVQNRALFWHEHIGGYQYRLRIRDNNPYNNKQWWRFDSRTKTIRSEARRNFALSGQRGQRFNHGANAVIRQWKGEVYQWAGYYGGSRRNIRNAGGKCLDVYGGRNTHNMHCRWMNCHNGQYQGWKLDTKSIRFPANPLRNGLKF